MNLMTFAGAAGLPSELIEATVRDAQGKASGVSICMRFRRETEKFNDFPVKFSGNSHDFHEFDDVRRRYRPPK